ncbi:hypothetical protein PIB30_037760 [Stylosanthes scabra]|uniref:Uncharacterized protein n=1 Tax=Stylosanthes scabra TaxID=79078 RepID=A0ABU6UFJ4_9FABA|nr:hypothetical protein [Stylosanthes scabra]
MKEEKAKLNWGQSEHTHPLQSCSTLTYETHLPPSPLIIGEPCPFVTVARLRRIFLPLYTPILTKLFLWSSLPREIRACSVVAGS